jgi:pimeloyl-ACP methyl ester carboxylesterase
MMIDRGTGIPVVVIPGIQGRWEWMAQTVDALAAQCRVITFSLCDEPTSGFDFEETRGLEAYVDQVSEAMRRANVERAVVIGISYSGLVAAEFAARYPNKVLGLVLSSALPLDWRPNARAKFYMRAPRLLSPLFWVTSPARMLPEIVAALPASRWLPFIVSYLFRALRAAVSPLRMARRVKWLETFTFSDPSRIEAQTLVITGEDRLDRIVPTTQSRQYVERVGRARHVTLPRTGHLGLVTKPEQFAALIATFVKDVADDAQRISA